jgi:hypothetical protein
MPNALKMFNRCLQGLPLVLALVAVSCTNVYFERPVPQSGAPVRGIPAEWAGLYVSEPGPAEAVSELEQIFQQCFRLELLSGTRLLVSQEWRLHENNLDQLRAALEVQKKEGKLIDFQLLGSLILYTMRSESGGQVEQQYVALIRQGEWYILPQTVAPFQLYDLEAGLQTQYEQEEPAAPVSEWLPGADTLSSKATRLVARQHAGGWYFNTQEKAPGG